MKNVAFVIAGLALTTMVGAGCSQVMAPGQASAPAHDQAMSPSAAVSEESGAQSTNPCNAGMSFGTGIHRYFGDCGQVVRIIGW